MSSSNNNKRDQEQSSASSGGSGWGWGGGWSWSSVASLGSSIQNFVDKSILGIDEELIRKVDEEQEEAAKPSTAERTSSSATTTTTEGGNSNNNSNNNVDDENTPFNAVETKVINFVDNIVKADEFQFVKGLASSFASSTKQLYEQVTDGTIVDKGINVLEVVGKKAMGVIAEKEGTDDNPKYKIKKSIAVLATPQPLSPKELDAVTSPKAAQAPAKQQSVKEEPVELVTFDDFFKKFGGVAALKQLEMIAPELTSKLAAATEGEAAVKFEEVHNQIEELLDKESFRQENEEENSTALQNTKTAEQLLELVKAAKESTAKVVSSFKEIDMKSKKPSEVCEETLLAVEAVKREVFRMLGQLSATSIHQVLALTQHLATTTKNNNDNDTQNAFVLPDDWIEDKDQQPKNVLGAIEVFRQHVLFYIAQISGVANKTLSQSTQQLNNFAKQTLTDNNVDKEEIKECQKIINSKIRSTVTEVLVQSNNALKSVYEAVNIAKEAFKLAATASDEISTTEAETTATTTTAATEEAPSTTEKKQD